MSARSYLASARCGGGSLSRGNGIDPGWSEAGNTMRSGLKPSAPSVFIGLFAETQVQLITRATPGGGTAWPFASGPAVSLPYWFKLTKADGGMRSTRRTVWTGRNSCRALTNRRHAGIAWVKDLSNISRIQRRHNEEAERAPCPVGD